MKLRDKADAVLSLVESRLPLFTQEIRVALSKINKGPPNTSPEPVLALIKEYPDHFADFIRRQTRAHQIKGVVVWTNPDTDREFHDIDVQIVGRYLRIAYQLEDHLSNCLLHSQFLAKYKRFADGGRKRALAQAKAEDLERFYSLPDAFASDECWDHWIGIAYLTADECAALALGRDPDVVSLATVKRAVGNGKSSFLEQYCKIMRFFERHPSNKAAGGARIEIKHLHAYLKDNSPKRPVGAVIVPNKDYNNPRDEIVSTVHSLYKICLALAIKQYPDLIERLNSNANSTKDPKGSIFGQMERDLNPIINKLNDGTLKRYIPAAYSFVRGKELLKSAVKPGEPGKIPEK